MRDILKSIFIWFLTTFFIEKAPDMAKALVQWSIQQLPENLRERYNHDLHVDLSRQQGPLSQLIYSLKIAFEVPSIRHNHGRSDMNFRSLTVLTNRINLIIMAFIMVLQMVSFFQPALILTILKPLVFWGSWIALISSPMAFYVVSRMKNKPYIPKLLQTASLFSLVLGLMGSNPFAVRINLESIVTSETAFFFPLIIFLILSIELMHQSSLERMFKTKTKRAV